MHFQQAWVFWMTEPSILSPWVTLTPADNIKFTTDGDAQLHSSPLGELNVEGAAARNHRLCSLNDLLKSS